MARCGLVEVGIGDEEREEEGKTRSEKKNHEKKKVKDSD